MLIIKDLTVEYQEVPLGLDVKNPAFSWKLCTDQKEVVQAAYEISVIQDGNVVWDSGIVKSNKSLYIEYKGEELTASTIYQIRVAVWDNKGNQSYIDGSFETGLLHGTSFEGEFISHTFKAEETACPIFYKDFACKKEVKQARIYATALGVYEININGIKVSDSFFAPGWTNYRKRLQYQTYDVTKQLAFAENEQKRIEIMVGNGWYKGILGFMNASCHYGNQVAALLELHIWYENGIKEVIKTDRSWKVTTGAVLSSEFYLGEVNDTLIEAQEGMPVVSIDYPKDRIISQECEPVRITERTVAKELIISPKGETILDFGQNMAGFVEIKIKGEKGQKIIIHHAETLDKEGNFYPDTLRSAKSVDSYVLNGEEQVLMPHFTFHGFRYIRIEGINEIILENFTACTLHTDMKVNGSFECSNPLINQLYRNITWGQRSNFLDVPTDCPQRDERLGWTGDAQVFCKTAAYNQNVAAFFRKWLRDLASEQIKELGVPHVIPNILGVQEGAAAWSDAATIIPWTLYQMYGDIRILREQYASMKDWVDYITSRCGENGLWQSGFQYGDWLALDKEESIDRTGATDKYLIANSFYLYSASIVRDSARILGKEEDVEKYGNLYNCVLKAFQEEYITSQGRMVSETQTGCVLALHFNLAKEAHRERILNNLKINIANHKNHLSTGFVGTPYLCHVLSDNGCHDLAGTLFMKEDYPSWLYSVKKGATTIWERWNSILPDGDFDVSGMNSLNHYAYGSIGDWMFGELAGIESLEPGFKKVKITPKFIKGIHRVKGSFESMYGTISSECSCMEGKIKIDIAIPANTTAIFSLPEKEEQIEAGSGVYHFEYETETNLKQNRFSLDSTLKEIMDEPLTIEIFKQQVPELLDNPMISMAYGMSISEMLANVPTEMHGLFQMVIDALNQQ